MALRSNSTSSSDTGAESRGSGSAPLGTQVSSRVLPEASEKRVTAAIVGIALLVVMVLPWWIATYPLLEKTPALAGWQMLFVGLGIGELPALTGFNGFGNFLFGGLPALTTLVLAGLWLTRWFAPRAIPGRTVGVWAVFTLFCQLWLLVLGWARLNATMGAHPATFGLLAAMMLTLFSAVALFGWWRRGEKVLWPSRGRFKVPGDEADAADNADSIFDESAWADDADRAEQDADLSLAADVSDEDSSVSGAADSDDVSSAGETSR
ncbi:hypothetical protein [Gulosibacter bifidus]|uniref:Uncharacterized protein n=1 Tax=Gulosibacter bifidus TaxID=272239 RepID=A0ABW5RH83_9MICO|nr:hypothetical protein [Gulosibacter bifidus]